MAAVPAILDLITKGLKNKVQHEFKGAKQKMIQARCSPINTLKLLYIPSCFYMNTDAYMHPMYTLMLLSRHSSSYIHPHVRIYTLMLLYIADSHR